MVNVIIPQVSSASW